MEAIRIPLARLIKRIIPLLLLSKSNHAPVIRPFCRLTGRFFCHYHGKFDRFFPPKGTNDGFHLKQPQDSCYNIPVSCLYGREIKISSEASSYRATDRDFIRPDTIDLYRNTNAHLRTSPSIAFLLEFPSLGGGSCLGGSMDVVPYNDSLSAVFAEHGILQAYTFPDPWS